MTRFILASGSPRRRELLSELKISFEVHPADVDETIDETKPLEKEIERLSFKKADAVYEMNPDAVVIGSDTIVTIDGKILGKPKTKEEAVHMLKMLSGKTHKVITGVSILSAKEGKNNLVKLTITQGSVDISSRSDEGNVNEHVSADVEGEDLVIGFNSKYLLDVLKAVSDEEVAFEMGTSVSSCLIKPVEGGEYTFLVLPVRIAYA